MSAFAALAILAAGSLQAASPALFEYHVRPHESLYDIGQRGLISPGAYQEVERLNHVVDAGRLSVGKAINIPYRLLKTTPIMVTVEGFRGEVEIASAGERSKAVVGRVIGEGAVVETGEAAFVRLSLPDGSHIALPSNSRIRFDRLRMIALTGSLDRALTLLKGRAESTVTPMTNPDSRYVIATPVATTAVRGTVFRTAYDAGHESAGVLRGSVTVSNAKSATLAHTDEGVLATTAGVSGPIALLPAPGLINADFPQTEEGLKFEITPVPGAKSYRLTLASDEAISTALLEKTLDAPVAEAASLPDGTYFAQLSAIAPNGLEGKAAVYPFVRVRNGLKVIGASKAGGGYLFNWESAGSTPATFHFELRRDGDAGPSIVDEPALGDTHFAVKALPLGDYRWRVTAIRKLDGRRVEAWSDPQTLRVSP